jgi:hypothetical protein
VPLADSRNRRGAGEIEIRLDRPRAPRSVPDRRGSHTLRKKLVKRRKARMKKAIFRRRNIAVLPTALALAGAIEPVEVVPTGEGEEK